MSDPNNIHGIELRDSAGHSLGTFHSDAAMQQLIAERDQLRRELESAQKKCEEYEKTIEYLSDRDYAITRQDIEDADRDGLSHEQFMAEFDRFVQENRNAS